MSLYLMVRTLCALCECAACRNCAKKPTYSLQEAEIKNLSRPCLGDDFPTVCIGFRRFEGRASTDLTGCRVHSCPGHKLAQFRASMPPRPDVQAFAVGASGSHARLTWLRAFEARRQGRQDGAKSWYCARVSKNSVT